MLRLCRLILLVAVMLMGRGTAVACQHIAERILERVEVVGVERVTHLSTSGMNLYLAVDNDTLHRLVVNTAEIDILSRGEVIATISLREKVVVKGKRRSTVLVPLRFKARSSFAVGRMLMRLLSDEQGLTINYRIRGGTALFRRTISATEVSVDELLSKSLLNDMSSIIGS
jgi:hypothetical protein